MASAKSNVNNKSGNYRKCKKQSRQLKTQIRQRQEATSTTKQLWQVQKLASTRKTLNCGKCKKRCQEQNTQLRQSKSSVNNKMHNY